MTTHAAREGMASSTSRNLRTRFSHSEVEVLVAVVPHRYLVEAGQPPPPIKCECSCPEVLQIRSRDLGKTMGQGW
jgi:hypothetical protein